MRARWALRATGGTAPLAVLATVVAAASLAAPAGTHAVESWEDELNLTGTATDSEWGLSHRSLATTSDGTLHVVWAERDGPNQTYRIWTRRLEPGAWSAPERIVDYLATDPGNPGDDIGAKYPSLAAAPNGDLHLFWHDYRVGGIDNVELFWKMRPASGTWDPSRAADVRLTTSEHAETPGQNAYVPVPAAAADGTVHVTWYDYRFDAWSGEILSKTRPAGGAWDLTPGDSADERVTNDTGHSELVDTALDGFGNLHAVWRSLDNGPRIRHAMRDPSTTTWSTPTLVDTSGTVAGAPAAAVDADGTLHVVWPDSRNGGRALFTRTRSASGVWSLQSERITRPEHGADEPSMKAAPDGTLHLVFSDGRESLLNREVFHRDRPPGASWDSTGAGDVRISVAAGTSSRPQVETDGTFVTVVWRDARDGNHEVYVRRGGPSATGAPLVDAGPPRVLAWPNPVRSESVRLTLPGGRPKRPGGESTLTVVDATGRVVRRLRGGPATWDLRTEQGRLVAPGTYFVRATTGELGRVTVLR